MENPFSLKVKGDKFSAEIASPMDIHPRNSTSGDPGDKFVELMNLDTYPGWCNGSSTMDHLFVSNGLSSLQPFPLGSFDTLNLAEQPSYLIPNAEASDGAGTSDNCGDKITCEQTDAQFVYPLGSSAENDFVSNGSNQQKNIIEEATNCMVSRPVGCSLDEKMLKALSFLREFSGDGILAQVWVPVRQGDQYVLTTSNQPYLLDKMLAGYREVSRTFTFSAEVKPGLPLGLPGRVFVSKVPEWTSNIVHYSKAEYVRVNHAVDHEVRGSIALPILEPSNMSCCAVLELVTIKEKSDFVSEIENICNALQAVNLRSTLPPRLLHQFLSADQRAALAEIRDVLRAVCHAHKLPLALTWLPCNYTEGSLDEIKRVSVKEGNLRPTGKCVLCVDDTACYVNDISMQGFVHACVEHYIEEGQGISGKALQSNHPFFIPDVKTYDISEYPLVHHTRKYGLNAAVAIRLRSTYTGDHDYILELFLPVNITGSQEQQLLLNNLSNTMQKICRSLRTVSDVELAASVSNGLGYQKESIPIFPQISVSERNSESPLSSVNLNTADKMEFNASSSKIDGTESNSLAGSRKQLEKKRSTAEKTVSLSVLQQYFSGSLKDAAKSIGVCPTTLKRICRQHGISRWPSRKINKVNRSLRKIQTVLDSVQGVEGGLKYDPGTGGFMAAGAMMDEFDSDERTLFPNKNILAQHSEPFIECVAVEGSNSTDKVEDSSTATVRRAARESSSPLVYGSDDSKSQQFGVHEALSPPYWFAGDAKAEKTSSQHRSWSSSSLAGGDESNTKMHGCSSVSHSSHGSESAAMPGCSSSSQSFKDGRHPRSGRSQGQSSGWKITMKATYKEDTIRFKFEACAGCFQLYEEVGKRFKLQTGTFQLKYLDDEEEWVLLTSDSDLHECCEILDYAGKESVKLAVRDTPFATGSSGSSNCFLAGNS
ncbi:Protein NLP8 [Linum perenne]